MRLYLLNYIKTHSWIYDIYYHIGSFLLKFLGIFIKIDEKTILFVSFGGKKFDDSPKALYDEMIKLEQFNDFKFYWAFVDTNKFEIPKGEIIKIDTLKYFLIALKSKIWITNSAIERGLNFKKKGNLYINTWHGTPLKKIGSDENSISQKSGFGSKKIYTQDISIAQSEYDAEIFSRVFKIDNSKILKCDLPRNDELSHINEEKINEVRKKLKIENGKKVILYAPTYREFERDKNNSCYLKPPVDFEKWNDKLGSNYLILFRAHYEVARVMGLEENEYIRDVSSYQNLNELMIASDMLISDYSSIFFDYAILEKPIFCFAYDLELYAEKRGLYIDLEKELPCSVLKTEDEVINSIIKSNYSEKVEKTKEFKRKYAPYAGESTKTIINLIERNVN